MAKWVFCSETKQPVRVDNEQAARIVEKGGRYLGKYEAARMLAAQDAKQQGAKQ